MSEQTQMDTLAYSSRMLSWAPLGKFLFVIAVLIVNIMTSSMLVPFVTLAIGLALMAYSTNSRYRSSWVWLWRRLCSSSR